MKRVMIATRVFIVAPNGDTVVEETPIVSCTNTLCVCRSAEACPRCFWRNKFQPGPNGSLIPCSYEDKYSTFTVPDPNEKPVTLDSLKVVALEMDICGLKEALKGSNSVRAFMAHVIENRESEIQERNAEIAELKHQLFQQDDHLAEMAKEIAKLTKLMGDEMFEPCPVEEKLNAEIEGLGKQNGDLRREAERQSIIAAQLNDKLQAIRKALQ